MAMQSNEATPAALYSGAAAGLLEFLDYARAKGILARKTADAYKSASSLALSIDGEGWENIEVRNVDVGQQLDRYIRLRGQKASPQTLATYRRRVAKAIELYLDFLDNPTGFRGSSGRPRPGGATARRPPATPASQQASRHPRPREIPIAEPSELLTYPFPLRAGGMAYLQLPRELTHADVKRLCSFLESLAIDTETGSARDERPGPAG
jgi:hypothetical protein